MTKHVMTLTYKPKIKPVRDGVCKQTLRVGRRFRAGDEVLIHGWEGKPYRSKWSWRLRVTLTDVIDVIVHPFGIEISDMLYPWSCDEIVRIAELDFIDPATGEALRDVLFGLNGVPDGPADYQIVRW